MNRKAFLLGAAMVMLVNFVAVSLRAYAETAFLLSYDKAQLPWLFVANAGGFAVATLGYDIVTRRASAKVVDLGLLLALISAAATAPSMLNAGAPPVFVVVAIAAVSQVVGLALWNRVAEAVAGRDARRNLPRAGAAVTAGGMLSGLGAGALGITGDQLSYLGAGVTAVVVVLAFAQSKALAVGGAPGAMLPPGATDTLGPLQLRLLRAMFAVAVLEGIVATVVDFQFLAELKTEYTGDTLAVALLLFYGGTNAFLLLLQATAIPRLLVTRSLPTTGGIHPTLVILWYIAVIAVPGLITIAGTRTADQVLRLATSRTAQEVSLSAFPPTPRARWKVLLRGAVWPAGAALGALVLLVVGPSALAHPVRLASVAIAVAIAWWIVARISARRFQAALAAPLNIQTRRKAEDPARIDLATLEQWTHAAGDDDPRTAALARAALARARVDATDLADQLRHDEPAVRAALFDQIARSPSPALVRELRAAVQIEDDDRALALGLKALAIAGDDGGLDRGRSRAALSREVADAVRTSELMLRGSKDLTAELASLCERDPSWAVALIRAQRARDPASLDDDTLAKVLADAAFAKLADAAKPADAALGPVTAADAARRAGALSVIAHVGPPSTLPILDEALAAAAPDAIRAIETLDDAGVVALAARLPVARVSRGAASSTALRVTDDELGNSAPRSRRDKGASRSRDAGVSASAGDAGASGRAAVDDAGPSARVGVDDTGPSARPVDDTGPAARVAVDHASAVADDVGASGSARVSMRDAGAGADVGASGSARVSMRDAGASARVDVGGDGAALLSPLARLTVARALAASPSATGAIGALLADPDPEVAHAALRTALAIARGGGDLPSAPIAAAHRAALAALVATLDARDAAHAASLAIKDEPDAGGVVWSACARHELELATRSCVARLMWASAVEVAAAGRDPATLAATARRLIGGREADRRRALDVIQELQAGRGEILAVIERWLRPAVGRGGSPDALAPHDPWLTRLCQGELAALESTIVALRRPPLFATVNGPTIATLAEHARRRTVDGNLFVAGSPGNSMFVVASGRLEFRRDNAPPRTIEAGGVVGELAVLTGAPRAAMVVSTGPADVIEIERDVFAAAARRAPELVLGLSATLAGWLAPNRPDVL